MTRIPEGCFSLKSDYSGVGLDGDSRLILLEVTDSEYVILAPGRFQLPDTQMQIGRKGQHWVRVESLIGVAPDLTYEDPTPWLTVTAITDPEPLPGWFSGSFL